MQKKEGKMSDYQVNIQARLLGFDDCETKINSLISKGSQGLKIPVNLTGKDGKNLGGKGSAADDINSQVGDLGKALSQAGSAAVKAFNGSFKASNFSPAIKGFVDANQKIQKATQGVQKEMKNIAPDISEKDSKAWSKKFVDKYVRDQQKAARDANKAVAAENKRNVKERIKLMQQPTKKQAHYNNLVAAGQKNLARLQKEQASMVSQAEKIGYNIETNAYAAKNSRLKSRFANVKQNVENPAGVQLVDDSIKDTSAKLADLVKAQEDFASNKTVQNAGKVTRAYDALSKSFDLANNNMSMLSNEQKEFASPKRLSNLQRAAETFWNDNNRGAFRKSNYASQVQSIIESSKAGNLSPADAEKLEAQLSSIRTTVNSEGIGGKSLFADLGRGLKQIGQFAMTYGAIQKGIQLVGDMANNVKQVDQAMIELRKVSDAPATDITSYLGSATKIAKDYGSTISDVVENTAEWSKLGYSLPESKDLARVSTLYQNVGDNISREDATSSLVSTLQGFKLEASEAESIIDKFNEVGRLNLPKLVVIRGDIFPVDNYIG